MSAPRLEPPAASGLLASLRALGATLAETAGVRGSLFALELGEEIERRKRLFVMAALSAAFLHMALVLLTAAVAVAFWDTHRVSAIVTLALAYLGIGIAALLAFHHRSAAIPVPFAATRDEIERDLGQLRAP